MGDRLYKLQEYILLFFIVSILGWLIEIILKLINKHKFINRGFLIGPYCPIYGSGTILITFFLWKYNNDIFVLFVMSTLICSILEYLASYMMEKMFNARWWDYSQYKYNLNGRICLVNSLLFGLGGTILMIFIVPTLINIINLISINTQNIIIAILLFIYVVDNVVSFGVIIKLRDLRYKYKNKDNTEEITKMIKKSLQSSIFIKRIKSAYPIVQNSFDDIIKNLSRINIKKRNSNIIKK